MKIIIVTLVLLFLWKPALTQNSLLNLRYEENYTPAYNEVIEMYQQLDSRYENAKLFEKGLTDVGKPLHLFVINDQPVFDVQKIKQKGKSVLLINNGIHPGEPAGIDASLQFADDILRNVNGMQDWLKNTVIVIIPVYNVGGHLNRSAYNRANQTTPYETGFRGNAKNLDLNRDFAKCDSENAKSFTKIFQEWNPDVFLDTHTTNGSDHQHSITLIPPFPDYFGKTQEDFLRKKMIPDLYEEMKSGEYELIPYVSWIHNDPKEGIVLWQDAPRYSSGYTGLFNSFGMMTENHVYKNYADRVKSCNQFIEVLTAFISANSEEIGNSRIAGNSEIVEMEFYPLTWKLDSTKYETIDFKGYEVDEQQVSQLTGLKRFGYSRDKPYSKKVKYFTTYIPDLQVRVPEFFVLPSAWKSVVDRLEWNGVELKRLTKDTTLQVYVDYIDDFSNSGKPYNGHYYHEKVTTRTEVQKIKYYAGDLIIPVRQKGMKYILEMLEPKATDSFFRWNFFDSVLDQREYFSSYGFEENALKYLKENPEFKKRFLQKRESDQEIAKNHRAQLTWIYENSEWAEKSFKRYPVAKIYEKLDKSVFNLKD